MLDGEGHHTGVGEDAQRSFEEGFLVGVLVGEGHLGGDGRQPHVILRMSTRHESLFRWIESRFPGGKLYGPYLHSGRNFFQWMARGAFLKDEIVPLFNRRLTPELDRKTYEAFEAMKVRYESRLARAVTPEERSKEVGTTEHVRETSDRDNFADGAPS